MSEQKPQDRTPAPAADSPKPHGDKLAGVVGTPKTASELEQASGDSPKPHGDKLQHATDVAAGRKS